MIKNFFNNRVFWIVMITILLGINFNSVTLSAPLTQTIVTEEERRRDDMLTIAERYANKEWTATDANICHDCEGRDYVHTPDAYHQLEHGSSAWWVTDAVNIGVPYYWGGTTTIGDEDLGLTPVNNGDNYFLEKLDEGKPAGDITTETSNGTQLINHSSANGVDCVGFINNVWRLGARHGSSRTKDISRPIRIEDLRTGDILQRYVGSLDHVMLFNRFVNYDPASSPPEVGIQFQVYEATLSYGKVISSTWELTSLVEDEIEFGTFGKQQTHIVTMTRLSDGEMLESVIPRTVFTPLDVVLVIDTSGSMGFEARMERVKEAAKMFVDLMRTGDKIGVVSFSSNAYLTYSLSEIDADSVKTDAKNAIDSLIPSGMTSMGAGLQLGHQELITNGVNSAGRADPVRLMILLGDGEENTPPYVDDVLPAIIMDNIIVHTLGLGYGADHELLVSIANQTGGAYRSASAAGIRYIFNSLLGTIYGLNEVYGASGMVPSGSTVEENVSIDSTIGTATFSLIWPGSDLDLTLVQPDGSVIDPSIAEADSNISFVSGSTYEFYKVFAPQDGEWTMRIYGNSTPTEGEEYTISVASMDAMIITVDADKTEYFVNDPIKLTASIEDSFSDSPLGPEYIYGVAMEVDVEDPALNQYSIELYDDGLNGDGEANDGVYANTFSNTSLEGGYNFNVMISGVNNRDGQPFTREYLHSTVVRALPEWLIFADGFESGDLSAWSGNVTDDGDLSVTTQASMTGVYGMQALINDQNAIYVEDESPNLETYYRASFEFDPNSITLPNYKSFATFTAYSPTSGPKLDAVVKIAFAFVGDDYLMQAGVLDESIGSYRVTPMVTLSDSPHTIEIEWQAASAPGANDGAFAFWVDGVQYGNLTNIDNDSHQIELARLGAVGGIDSGTSGTTYYDTFASYNGGVAGEAMAMEMGFIELTITQSEETEILDDFLKVETIRKK